MRGMTNKLCRIYIINNSSLKRIWIINIDLFNYTDICSIYIDICCIIIDICCIYIDICCIYIDISIIYIEFCIIYIEIYIISADLYYLYWYLYCLYWYSYDYVSSNNCRCIYIISNAYTQRKNVLNNMQDWPKHQYCKSVTLQKYLAFSYFVCMCIYPNYKNSLFWFDPGQILKKTWSLFQG